MVSVARALLLSRVISAIAAASSIDWRMRPRFVGHAVSRARHAIRGRLLSPARKILCRRARKPAMKLSCASLMPASLFQRGIAFTMMPRISFRCAGRRAFAPMSMLRRAHACTARAQHFSLTLLMLPPDTGQRVACCIGHASSAIARAAPRGERRDMDDAGVAIFATA